MSDIVLVSAIRKVLVDSPFHGEGYRKVWARLRHAGLKPSQAARRGDLIRVEPLRGSAILHQPWDTIWLK